MSNESDELQRLLDSTADDTLKSPAGDATEQIPNDRIPGTAELDVNIPDDELTEHIMANFKNEILDKEDMGWKDKREYDRKAYYEVKDEFAAQYPYPNASNFPVCITSVLLDTGCALINDLVWRNSSKVVTVSPQGDENPKKSKNLEWLMNWQVLNDMANVQLEDNASNFFALLHGTSYEKVFREFSDEYQLGVQNIPIEHIFLPIDRKSPDIKDSENVTQLIPLGSNDLRMRVASGRYRNLNKVGKGYFPQTMSVEMLARLQRQISGLDVENKISRDTWWIAERYMTYYPRGSMRAQELIVWFSPQTGAILRKIKNKENLRPFVDKYFYPNYGYAFHFSMPERIRHIQDKANYQDKQVTDAADKAISPAGFYEGNSGFDPKISLRAPTAMYRVKNLGQIQWEPVNIAAIMERNRDLKDLWLQAERKTGFTDLQQGVTSAASANTLGQDEMRQQSADVRFGGIRNLVNYHWKRKMNLIYQYDDMYMPRTTKIKVLGQNRFEKVEILFPREQTQDGSNQSDVGGMTGKYNFAIANKSIQEQMREDQKRTMLAGEVLADPVFGTDKGTRYRAIEMRWEANGVQDLEFIVKRPPEAGIPTPDEVIERLMDGEEIVPDPSMNPADYISIIEMFTRTGNFKEVTDQKIKQRFGIYLTLLDRMKQARALAFNDHNLLSGMKGSMTSNGDGSKPEVTPPPISEPVRQKTNQ
jgi:hypothetical protein